MNPLRRYAIAALLATGCATPTVVRCECACPAPAFAWPSVYWDGGSVLYVPSLPGTMLTPANGIYSTTPTH